MRLEAALVGNLKQVMADELRDGAAAVTLGTRHTTDALKNRLRAMVVAAFGSERLAKTWRGDTFPRGAQTSLGAAGTVYSKAPHIIEAFSKPTTLRNKDGFYLAIPSKEALAMRVGNKRPTPHEIEQRLGIKLQFVYRPGKAGLLVADLRRRTGKRGGFAAPSATATRKGNTESVVMFFLVKIVRLKQRFDLEAEYNRALDELVANIMTEWNRT